MATTAQPAAAQSVWELTPYRIEVLVAAGRAPELTAQFEADLAQDLLARADAFIGAAWDVGVTRAPAPLRFALLRGVESLSAEQIEKAWADLPPPAVQDDSPPASQRPAFDQTDKVILLAVAAGRSGSSGYQVVARELDVRTRRWSTPAVVPVWHPAKLSGAAFAAVLRAFAPLAQIAAVEENVVTLRLRAGALPLRDQDVTMVRPGDVFQPVIRHDDRYGKLKAANPVPWTFLTVDAVAGAGLSSTMHTGLRSPLSGRRRGRVQPLALRVAPPGKPTRLTLRARTSTDQVLPGYDVYSHPPDAKTTVLVGRTDRRGEVVIPPAESPLRVLLVKNGSEFLARLPMVPGLEAEAVAEIANDDQRLEAEGFISGLQEELIDQVTRREVLLAQARRRLEEAKYDEAEKLLRQLQGRDTPEDREKSARLKSREDFVLDVSREQKKVFSPDKLIQAKIDQMFSKTLKLVDAYLDPAPVDQLERQLYEARARKVDSPF